MSHVLYPPDPKQHSDLSKGGKPRRLKPQVGFREQSQVVSHTPFVNR